MSLPAATATDAASGAAADHSHERRIEIDAAITHVTDLFGLRKCIGDVTGLAGWTGLQHESRCASHHRRTERGAPPCSVVAARIRGDHGFARRREGNYAGTEVGEGASEIVVRAGADSLNAVVTRGINQGLGAVIARRGNHDHILGQRVLHGGLQAGGRLRHAETHADDVGAIVRSVINSPNNI